MIDVIIPVYNTPIEDLKRCFESIQNQTYNNWNAIIIDDGSKEDVYLWLDDWSNKDKRFIVKHIKNCGVSNARNYALSISNSDYVVFCDSDDCLTDRSLEEGILLIEKYNADMVIGGTKLVYNGDKHNHIVYAANKEALYDEENINKLFEYLLTGKPKKDDNILNKLLAARVYSKIYKRELIDNLVFPNDLKIHEDNFYSFKILMKCKKVFVTDSIWYEYYQNDYSLTHQNYNENSLTQEMIFANKVYLLRDFLIERNLYEPFKIRMFNIMVQYLKNLRKKEGDKKEKIKELFDSDCFIDVENIKISKYRFFNFSNYIFAILINIKNKSLKIFLLNILLDFLSNFNI